MSEKYLMKNNNAYKLTFRKHIQILTTYFFYVAIILLYAGYVRYKGIMITEVEVAFIFVFIIITILTLFLHFEYNKYCRGLSVRLEYPERQIIVRKGDKEGSYYFSDIEKALLNIYPSILSASSRFFPTEAYYFARVFLKNGEVILLTNLMIPDLKDVLENMNVNIEVHKVLYPSIDWTI